MNARASRGGHRRYRQGVILGLTVAEMLVLVCFALLLLAAQAVKNWQVADERLIALEQTQRDDPLGRLDTSDREKIIAAVAEGRLGPALALKLNAERLRRLSSIVEAGDFDRLMVIADQLRGSGVDSTGLASLLQLVQRHGTERLHEAASIARALERGAILVRDPDMAKLLAQNTLRVEELRRSLEIIDTYGLPAIEAALAANSGLRKRVIDAVDSAGRELAASVTGAIAPIVERARGTIDPRTGAVTFPEAVLFGPGEATIPYALSDLLGQVCQPWVDALCRVGGHVGEIRIEGHASSEWSGESDPRRAFLNNLDLSQRRASAVLERCLALAGDTPAGVWARSRLVAVGHSSARPILAPGGAEDPRRSRRVVFRAEIDSDAVLRRLDAGRALEADAPTCR